MVAKTSQNKQIEIKGATIPKIVEVIKHAENRGEQFIQNDLINRIKGRSDKETYRNLWSLLRQNVKYKADGKNQDIKSPSALWGSGVGDCKSFTVFVSAVLRKLGKPYEMVLDRYDKDFPNRGHIYIRSEGIIVDPVNPTFNVADKAYKRETVSSYKPTSIGALPEKTGSFLIPILAIITILFYE